jgi:glutathione S-transferase
MSTTFRLFGSEMSPYSVKVRAFLRYKRLEHQWVPRNPTHQAEFERHARLPLIPLLVTPEDDGLQDSTPIMAWLDERFPHPVTQPEDPRLAFLSALFEEYGDEWGNKLMFHHRWYGEVDQRATALVLARGMNPDGSADEVAALAEAVRERMSGRRHFTGSSDEAAPLLTAWFERLIARSEALLVTRPYLLGGRPCWGDFGLAAQLYECGLDPTCGGLLRARAPATLAWCYRMLDPVDLGDHLPWDEAVALLEPLLEDVGGCFLPWSHANAQALAAGEETFTVTLGEDTYTQAPQKYHAKSLAALRDRFGPVADDPALRGLLDRTECLPYLGR